MLLAIKKPQHSDCYEVVWDVLHRLQGQAEPASSGLIIRDLIHRCFQIHPGTETFSGAR